MDRRTFISCTLAIFATPITAEAQRQGRLARVGVLIVAQNRGVESAFPGGLSELGYVEGRNVTIDWRSADGRSDQMDALAAELVQLGPGVTLAGGPEARIAAMKATSNIPIVTVGGSDPVAEGWAASLGRPAGNVTGLTVTYPELIVKKLELISQLIPGLSRVAVIRDPNATPPSVRAAQIAAMRTAASSLRIDVEVIEVRGPADFDTAFQQAIQHRRQALNMVETSMMFAHRDDIAELARKMRLPTIGEWKLSANAGFLATYGADLSDLLRRAASHVDKILKGAKAGALPIERPTKFELVINLKTAKALGLTMSKPLRLRADQLIE